MTTRQHYNGASVLITAVVAASASAASKSNVVHSEMMIMN